MPAEKRVRLFAVEAESMLKPTEASAFELAAIRPADAGDLNDLLILEQTSFTTDRLNRRSFRHLVLRAHADCLVSADTTGMRGYIAVLYRRNARTGRIHSLAVAPRAQRFGTARALLESVEEAARSRRQNRLRLAVRQDNEPAIRLYRSSGYRQIATELRYYSDGMAAFHMEKSLAAST